jgi:hypothetical protein
MQVIINRHIPSVLDEIQLLDLHQVFSLLSCRSVVQRHRDKVGHNRQAIDIRICRPNLYCKSIPYTYIGDLANHSAGCRHAGASVNQHRCIVAKISIPTSCDRNSSHLKVFFAVFHGNMPICIDALATHKDLQSHESVGRRSGIALHLQDRQLCIIASEMNMAKGTSMTHLYSS